MVGNVAVHKIAGRIILPNNVYTVRAATNNETCIFNAILYSI